MTQLRHREVKKYTQNHTVNKHKDLNSGKLALESIHLGYDASLNKHSNYVTTLSTRKVD